jgi:hypothetical protein
MTGRTTSAVARRSEELTLVTKRNLSPEQRELLLLLQRIRYGRIECLEVRDGQPYLKGVRWTQKVKVLGDQAPHPAIQLDDFTFHQELSAFFQQFKRLGHGQVINLEIRNGIPFCYELNDSLAP